MVANETDTPSNNEQAVERTNLDVLVGLFARESTRVPEQVDEAHSDASIDVQDEGILLRGGDLLNSESVVEERVAREVLRYVLLHKLDTEIGVVHTLNFVSNTAN